jgi:hypothetical protein
MRLQARGPIVCSFVLLGSLACLASLAAVQKPPAAGPPQALRLSGPDVLGRGSRTYVLVEGLFEGKTWKALEPDAFTVKVSGEGKLLDDPAGKAMNPIEIRAEDADSGKIVVEVRCGDRSASKSITLGTPKIVGRLEATINPSQSTHRFSGFGGGVLFYDNQFDIAAGDEIYDWCFRDVNTSFLHILIRPNYKKDEDNDDWRVLDLTKYDFKSLERPLRIIKKAKERNPNIKLYASLYSPPAWMKTNNSTAGRGGLKDGARYRQELAKYIFAYLKHLHQNEITVDYLSFFNEPDFLHDQDGMHVPDLGVLAETFVECTKALETLLARDADLKKGPVYVFPDLLGAGSVTRSGANSKKLQARARQLDKVGVWGVHDYWNQTGTYWNERFHELRAFPGVSGKPVWMTEWAQRFRRGDLASGVEYGTHILNAVRLGAEAWMVFEWCHPSGNQSGLISTQWDDKTRRYWRSKAYQVFRQIANTTPGDSTVLTMKAAVKGTGKTIEVEYLAVKHGDDVVFHIMNAEPNPVSYGIKIVGKAEKAKGLLTTPNADLAEAGAQEMTFKAEASGVAVSGVVPGYSLLSVVVPGAAEKKKSP